MIAQYQIAGYGSASDKKTSTHIFKHNDRWYKVTIKVNEMVVNSPETLEDIK